MSGYSRAPIVVGGGAPLVRVFHVIGDARNANHYELGYTVRREWQGTIFYVRSGSEIYFDSVPSATVYLPRAADLRYVRRVMALIGWRVDRIIQQF